MSDGAGNRAFCLPARYSLPVGIDLFEPQHTRSRPSISFLQLREEHMSHRARARKNTELKYSVVLQFNNLGLHAAAAAGNLGLMKYALSQGQPINSLLDGVLPIHAACSGGSEMAVKLLLEQGANVNTPRLIGHPATELESILVSPSSSAQSHSSTGTTALHFAVAHGHASIVRLLLDHGAFILPDKQGISPRMLASRNGWLECAEILEGWEDAHRASVDGEGRGLQRQMQWPEQRRGSDATEVGPVGAREKALQDAWTSMPPLFRATSSTIATPHPPNVLKSRLKSARRPKSAGTGPERPRTAPAAVGFGVADRRVGSGVLTALGDGSFGSSPQREKERSSSRLGGFFSFLRPKFNQSSSSIPTVKSAPVPSSAPSRPSPSRPLTSRPPTARTVPNPNPYADLPPPAPSKKAAAKAQAAVLAALPRPTTDPSRLGRASTPPLDVSAWTMGRNGSAVEFHHAVSDVVDRRRDGDTETIDEETEGMSEGGHHDDDVHRVAVVVPPVEVGLPSSPALPSAPPPVLKVQTDIQEVPLADAIPPPKGHMRAPSKSLAAAMMKIIETETPAISTTAPPAIIFSPASSVSHPHSPISPTRDTKNRDTAQPVQTAQIARLTVDTSPEPLTSFLDGFSSDGGSSDYTKFTAKTPTRSRNDLSQSQLSYSSSISHPSSSCSYSPPMAIQPSGSDSGSPRTPKEARPLPFPQATHDAHDGHHDADGEEDSIYTYDEEDDLHSLSSHLSFRHSAPYLSSHYTPHQHPPPPPQPVHSPYPHHRVQSLPTNPKLNPSPKQRVALDVKTVSSHAQAAALVQRVQAQILAMADMSDSASMTTTSTSVSVSTSSKSMRGKRHVVDDDEQLRTPTARGNAASFLPSMGPSTLDSDNDRKGSLASKVLFPSTIGTDVTTTTTTTNPGATSTDTLSPSPPPYASSPNLEPPHLTVKTASSSRPRSPLRASKKDKHGSHHHHHTHNPKSTSSTRLTAKLATYGESLAVERHFKRGERQRWASGARSDYSESEKSDNEPRVSRAARVPGRHAVPRSAVGLAKGNESVLGCARAERSASRGPIAREVPGMWVR